MGVGGLATSGATKTKHSRMGTRLIAAMKEVVDHVEGNVALPGALR